MRCPCGEPAVSFGPWGNACATCRAQFYESRAGILVADLWPKVVRGRIGGPLDQVVEGQLNALRLELGLEPLGEMCSDRIDPAA